MKGRNNTISTMLLTLLLSFGFVDISESKAAGTVKGDVKDSERVYRQTAVGEGALTEQMIENCIVLKRDIDSGLAEAMEAKAQYDALAKETNEIGAFLNEVQAAKMFDPSDSQALAAYNAKTELYNSKLTENKQQFATYKAKSDLYNQQVSRFDMECKGQTYYEDDYNKMVKKMGSGM